MSQNIIKLFIGMTAVNIAGTISLIGMNLYDIYNKKKIVEEPKDIKKEEKKNPIKDDLKPKKTNWF